MPVLFLYPLHAQSDFIKAFAETENLNDHLSYILPVPWDAASEYASADGVECYIETAAADGGNGLLKAGKKMALGKVLGSGKVAITDGMVKVYVVPKAKAVEWVGEWKARQPRR